MHPEHILVFVQYLYGPASEARLVSEDFSVKTEGLEFVRGTADEVVYGDDETEVIGLDGRRCVGNSGETCAKRGAHGVEVCDVFRVDAAFTEIVLGGICGFGCRQDDTRHLSAYVSADGMYDLEATAKARRQDAIGRERVNDEDIVPFVARGHDVREEGVDDETAEGEHKIGGYHQDKVQTRVPYADEERPAERIVKERDEHPSEDARYDIEAGDLARSSFIVEFFGGNETYE